MSFDLETIVRILNLSHENKDENHPKRKKMKNKCKNPKGPKTPCSNPNAIPCAIHRTTSPPNE